MPTILQQPPQHRLPVFRPAEAFRRWYGANLSPHQSDIINALESVRQCATAPLSSSLSTLQRAHHTAPRVLVIDPPGETSLPLLTAYLSFLDAISPDSDRYTLIVTPDRTALREAASYSYPNASLVTVRQAYAIRGQSYNRLLMLNIDRYRTLSPFRELPIRWSRIYQNLVTPLSVSSDSIVILHMTLPGYRCHQRRRLEHLSRILPTVFNLQPDILERTRDFVRRILDHNRRLNHPIAIPLDFSIPSSDPPGDPPDGNHELCIMHRALPG